MGCKIALQDDMQNLSDHLVSQYKTRIIAYINACASTENIPGIWIDNSAETYIRSGHFRLYHSSINTVTRMNHSEEWRSREVTEKSA